MHINTRHGDRAGYTMTKTCIIHTYKSEQYYKIAERKEHLLVSKIPRYNLCWEIQSFQEHTGMKSCVYLCGGWQVNSFLEDIMEQTQLLLFLSLPGINLLVQGKEENMVRSLARGGKTMALKCKQLLLNRCYHCYIVPLEQS